MKENRQKTTNSRSMQQNSHTSKLKKTRILIRDPLPALLQTQKNKIPFLFNRFFSPLSLSLPSSSSSSFSSSSWETFFHYQICKPKCTSPITTTTTRTTYKTLFFPPLSLSLCFSSSWETFFTKFVNQIALLPSPSPRGLLTELLFFSLFLSLFLSLSLSSSSSWETFSLPNLQTKLHHHDNNEDNLQYGDHTM